MKRRDRKNDPAGPPGSADTRTGRLVLVVDDDNDQREMYGTYLVSQGFRVTLAADGMNAVEQATTLQPDVIVLDLAMPRVDGWEAARRLKRDPHTAHIPIVACSAHVLGGAVERALDAGCDAYVMKPCLPADLVEEIRRVLGRRERGVT